MVSFGFSKFNSKVLEEIAKDLLNVSQGRNLDFFNVNLKGNYKPDLIEYKPNYKSTPDNEVDTIVEVRGTGRINQKVVEDLLEGFQEYYNKYVPRQIILVTFSKLSKNIRAKFDKGFESRLASEIEILDLNWILNELSNNPEIIEKHRLDSTAPIDEAEDSENQIKTNNDSGNYVDDETNIPTTHAFKEKLDTFLAGLVNRRVILSDYIWESENELEQFLRAGIWQSPDQNMYNLLKSTLKRGDLIILKSAQEIGDEVSLTIPAIGIIRTFAINNGIPGVEWLKTDATIQFPNSELFFNALFILQADDLRVTFTYIFQQRLDLREQLVNFIDSIPIETSQPIPFKMDKKDVRKLIGIQFSSNSKFWWLNTERNIELDIQTNPEVAGFGEPISLENLPKGISEGEVVIANYQGNNDIWGLVQFSEYKTEDEYVWFKLLFELAEDINVSDLLRIPGFEDAYNSFVPNKLYELDSDLFLEILKTTELGSIDLDDSSSTVDEKTEEEPKDFDNPMVTLAYSDSVKNTEDLLDVGREIEVFARLLAQKDLSPPLAIALFGNWGSGKSFFMHNLEISIKQLSDSNTLKSDDSQFYCKEIVHISFNAWSYLDANLWIGFMASIFEKLDEYLTGITKDEKEKLELEEKFVHKLEFVQNQKTRALLKKQNLEKEKEKLESKLKGQERELSEKIEEIKNEKWSSITSAVWEQISNDDEIKNNLDKLGITPEVLEKSPSQYVKNSINSFKNYLRQFKSFKLPQIIGSLLILITLILVPILFNWIIESLSNILYTTLPIFLGISIKISAAWKFLKPFADKALNIQTQYVQKLKEKEREHLENLSQLQLEKANKSQEIQDLSDEIEELEDEISDVEYSLKHSLTRMALNNFISERSMSADYQNKLGVISIIRKDLETLSALFISQKIDERLPQKEQEKLQEKQEELAKIRKQFGKRPLERIILYIDDLDRCPDEKVLDVLQAVHLLMAFPLFIVVVGVDKRCVTNALYNREVSKYFRLEEYGEIAKDVESKGREENTNGIHIIHPDEYLEKIFQIPFQLQKPEPKSIQKMIHKLLEKDILDENIPDSKSEASSLSETIKSVAVESKHDDSKAGSSHEQKNQSEEQNVEGKEENQELDVPPDSDEKAEVPPDALRISKTEREYIKNISPLIGSTPRTIKRFINIYRLIRAHQDLSGINQDKEYLIVIFILAMHLGECKKVADGFFSTVRVNTYLNLEEILQLINDEKIQEVYLTLNDNKLKRLLTVKGIDIITYLTFIRRFSFNALDERLPLVQMRDSKGKDFK